MLAYFICYASANGIFALLRKINGKNDCWMQALVLLVIVLFMNEMSEKGDASNKKVDPDFTCIPKSDVDKMSDSSSCSESDLSWT